MEEIEFYDVKSKNKFKTTEYRLVEKKSVSKVSGKEIVRFFVVSKSPTGEHECWKVVSKDTAEKLR